MQQRRHPELHHPTPTHPPNPYAEAVSDPQYGYSHSARGSMSSDQQQPPLQQQPQQSHPQHYQQQQYAQQQQQQQYQQQQQQQYGNNIPPQAAFGWGGQGHPIPPWANDPTAQMGMQLGRNAIHAGQDYLSKNVTRHLPVQHLQHSFNVSNTYVLKKLRLVLFPWRHKPWSRLIRRSEASGQAEGYRPPREDINAPDLYIPVMALVTYILLAGMVYGFRQDFHPEKLGMTASKSFAVVFIEFCAIKLGCYLLNIGGEGTVLDLLAYSGYKFVGIIITMLSDLLRFKGMLYWGIFLYVFLANAFFLLRSLRNVVLPDPSFASSNSVSHAQRSRRLHFLFAIAVSQIASMWLLVRV